MLERAENVMYFAKKRQEGTDNKYLDFSDIIWESDAAEICDILKREGIGRFTISCEASNMLETFMELQKCGYKMCGMENIKADYIDYETKQNKIVPAIVFEKVDNNEI